jgi:hypothetical protein
MSGVKVYAFSGTTYTGYSATSDSNGQIQFTLPQGDYRFRADYNSTQFWSGVENHCSVPGCSVVTVTVTRSLTVTIQDTNSVPKAGLKVYAFNGTTYTGYSGTADANGQVFFTLPQGSYRFRADLNGTQFWSGASNHCAIPGCYSSTVIVTNSVTATILDTDGAPKSGLKVYAFNGTTYTGYSGTTDTSGHVLFTLPLGSYRFRADYNGTQFWSGASNHCAIPGCDNATVTVTKPATITVKDSGGALKVGLKVYAFNGSTYTGYSGTTDMNGQVVFTLPQGPYRFRADLNGAQYWSEAQNHCTIPGCTSVNITTNP